MRTFARLMRSTRAATAIEYGLLLAMIFLASMVAITDVGNSTGTMWNNVSSAAVAVL